MATPTTTPRSTTVALLATATAMIAYQVGARATRDAYFLTNFPVTMLPAMMMATSVLAVALAYASTLALTRWGPERVVPAAFAASAGLLLLAWAVSLVSHHVAAVLVYLHYGCFGALLVSGFYSFLNERFDPRSAKRELARVTAAGTVGGLIGGLAAERVGHVLPITAMLPVLATFHAVCAAGVTRLRSSLEVVNVPDAPREGAPPAAGVRALLATSYIRGLIALVLLVTISEGLIDLVLKGRATAAVGGGGQLLRFFAAFYTGASLLTVIVQAALSRVALEKLGPARAAAVLPAAMAATSAGAIAIPGLATAAIARGSDFVLSNSLYRGGYEVLFTPVPSRDKRSIKSLVDVGASRAGDLLAAGIAGALVLAMPLKGMGNVLFAIAAALSVCGVVVALRLHGGYVQALANGLISRAVRLDLAHVMDSTTRETLLRTIGAHKIERHHAGPDEDTGEDPAAELLLRIRGLRSPDVPKVLRALHSGPITPELLPHAIELLARNEVAQHAINVLRETGAPAVDPLIERLLDPDTDFVIRRRIPLVLGAIYDRRAADGLLRGLADKRFEVRYRCGRGLAHLLDVDAMCWVSPKDVFAAVLREIQSASGVWETRNLLDKMDDEEWSPVMGEVVRDRANRSLEHVFTLLALVLPRKPLRVAFQGLHTEDRLLRATALEYLESSLPPQIRRPLWPFLEDNRPRRAEQPRPTEEALDALLKSNASISLKLEEIRRKERTPPG
ncbi:MAG TPA: HEAT repeat domain-containing protein [Candidatus Limnocylindrales bacterium]|nr:HEAT repeat domain-containing protein [Candidatus Limnocylindrales bacterium]